MASISWWKHAKPINAAEAWVLLLACCVRCPLLWRDLTERKVAGVGRTQKQPAAACLWFHHEGVCQSDATQALNIQQLPGSQFLVVVRQAGVAKCWPGAPKSFFHVLVHRLAQCLCQHKRNSVHGCCLVHQALRLQPRCSSSLSHLWLTQVSNLHDCLIKILGGFDSYCIIKVCVNPVFQDHFIQNAIQQNSKRLGEERVYT